MTLLSRTSFTSSIEVRVRAIDERRLLDRIRAEFVEMPGLNLTLAQAQRLWGLDRLTCEYLCNRLIEERFLERTYRDTFVRRGADGLRTDPRRTH